MPPPTLPDLAPPGDPGGPTGRQKRLGFKDDKVMRSLPAKGRVAADIAARAKEQRDRLRRLQAAKKIQRCARGALVRWAVDDIIEFEDTVLRVPMSGQQAIQMLLRGLTADDSASVASGMAPSISGTSVAASARTGLNRSLASLPVIQEGSRAPSVVSSRMSKAVSRPASVSSSRGGSKGGDGSHSLRRFSRPSAGGEQGKPDLPAGAAKLSRMSSRTTLVGDDELSPTSKRSVRDEGDGSRSVKRPEPPTPKSVKSDAHSKRGDDSPGKHSRVSRNDGAGSVRSRKTSSRFGEEVSKKLGKLGKGRKANSRLDEASLASLSRQSSSVTATPPIVPADLLVIRLEEAGYEAPVESARAILKFLGSEELDVFQMQRIYRHHKLRQFNIASRVVLYLTLVHHGDSDHSGEFVDALDPNRELQPEGWRQATRSAWSLRLQAHTDWLPSAALTSTSLPCTQTAERILSVISDEPQPVGLEALRGHSSLRRGSHFGSVPSTARTTRTTRSRMSRVSRVSSSRRGRRVTPHTAQESELLDYPIIDRDGNVDLGARFDRVSAALLAAATEAAGPPPPREWGLMVNGVIGVQLQKPPTVLAVLGGTLLETSLACLTAHTKRKMNDPLPVRIYGGDVVLLKSGFMCQIVGEEPNQHLRPVTELWEEALRRGDWSIAHHLHGDGRKPRPKAKTSLADLADMDLESLPVDGWYGEKTGERWRRYVGEPLVWGPKEWDVLYSRAASEYTPVPVSTMKSLFPCVKDYEIPDGPLDLDALRSTDELDLDDDELIFEEPT